jgi:hypothetical protein
MAGDLSGLESLIGGGLSNTFGIMGIPIFALLFLLMVSVALRAGWEVTMTFVIAAIVILAINYQLPVIVTAILVFVGSLIIWAAFSRVFRL